MLVMSGGDVLKAGPAVSSSVDGFIGSAIRL
jgi:hypothetical protein